MALPPWGRFLKMEINRVFTQIHVFNDLTDTKGPNAAYETPGGVPKREPGGKVLPEYRRGPR